MSRRALLLPIQFGEIEWGLGRAIAAQLDLVGHRFLVMIQIPPIVLPDPARHRECLRIAIEKATREIMAQINGQVRLGAISLHMPQEAA